MITELLYRILDDTKNSDAENGKNAKQAYAVTIVGAGGKTSCLFQISEELQKSGKNHWITTTTQIYEPGNDQYDKMILTDQLEEPFPAFPKAKKGYRVLVGKGITEDKKMQGISKDDFDKFRLGNPNYIALNEGDGAKRKNIKAPRIGEPVIPETTDVVIGVIGMRVLGQRIDDEHVHRVQEFLEITKKQRGDRITKEDLLSLVNHPKGLFKDVPEGAKKILLLNQAEDETLQKAGKEILIKSRCSGGVGSLHEKLFYYTEVK